MVLFVQNRLRNESRIPATDQDLSAEVNQPGREDRLNDVEGGDETSERMPLYRGIRSRL